MCDQGGAGAEVKQEISTTVKQHVKNVKASPGLRPRLGIAQWQGLNLSQGKVFRQGQGQRLEWTIVLENKTKLGLRKTRYDDNKQTRVNISFKTSHNTQIQWYAHYIYCILANKMWLRLTIRDRCRIRIIFKTALDETGNRDCGKPGNSKQEVKHDACVSRPTFVTSVCGAIDWHIQDENLPTFFLASAQTFQILAVCSRLSNNLAILCQRTKWFPYCTHA